MLPQPSSGTKKSPGYIGLSLLQFCGILWAFLTLQPEFNLKVGLA